MRSRMELPMKLVKSAPHLNRIGNETTYSLLKNQSPILRQLHQLLRLGCIRCKRLLAKHMLPRLQRLGRPLVMQSVGRGDVHKVNFGIVEQIFVGTVGFYKIILFFGFLGCGEVARGDGVKDYGRVGFGRADYFSCYQYRK